MQETNKFFFKRKKMNNYKFQSVQNFEKRVWKVGTMTPRKMSPPPTPGMSACDEISLQ